MGLLAADPGRDQPTEILFIGSPLGKIKVEIGVTGCLWFVVKDEK